MIELNPAQRRFLRAEAHHLHPVVSVSQNGLSDSVLKEIDVSLKAHELIKVKLYGIERVQRDALLGQICDQLGCAAVQHVGNTLVLWRPRPVADAADGGGVAAKTARPRTKKQAAAASESKAKVPARRTARAAPPPARPRRRAV